MSYCLSLPSTCSLFFQSYGHSNGNGYSSYNGSHGGGYGGGGGGFGGSWGGDRMSDGLGGGLRSIDWSQHKQIPFEKNFYVEDKRVSSRSDREIEEFRRVKEIKVSSTQSHRVTLI
jgi:ATP-dependent RNA helicase DDX5/DBP2